MQTYSIIIAKRFTDELGEILDFIAHSSPNNALRFSNEIYAKIATLSTMPYRTRQNSIANDKNMRDMIFKGCIIVFFVNENTEYVEILEV